MNLMISKIKNQYNIISERIYKQKKEKRKSLFRKKRIFHVILKVTSYRRQMQNNDARKQKKRIYTLITFLFILNLISI